MAGAYILIPFAIAFSPVTYIGPHTQDHALWTIKTGCVIVQYVLLSAECLIIIIDIAVADGARESIKLTCAIHHRA